MTKNNIKQIVFMIMLSVVAILASSNVCEAAANAEETKCTHTYSAATCSSPKKCTKCGNTSGYPLAHDYEINGNVATCKECGVRQIIETEEENTHTCTWSKATCTKPKTCKICGATSGYPMGHNYEICGNARVCTECGDKQMIDLDEEEVHTHIWIDATCTTPKTCKTCGITTGNKLNHNFSIVVSSTEATCNEKGKVVKKCSRCTQTQTTTTNALGHSYKEVRKEATCTTSGEVKSVCANCGDVKDKTTIAPLGHKFENITSTATCTQPGKTEKKCSVCGTKVPGTTTPALGHDFSVIVLNVDASCTEAGKVEKKCSRCDVKQATNVPALGHDECIVFNSDYHWFECDVCNSKLTDKENHIFEDSKCTVCGYSYEDDYEPDDDDNDENDGELIIEPWMKENDELDCLAVSLRSEPYKEERANKNIYELDEKIIYYVDYKNGGKDIKKEVTLTLELPLSFSVVDSDGAKVTKSKKTLTWTFDGMENDESGTKVVIVKYTSLGKSSLTYKRVTPKATILVGKTEKDISAVLNLVVKDFDDEVEDEHEPYMFGDEDTGTFRPDDAIDRGEGALVLTRIFGISTKYDSNTYAFPDLNETYLEARKAVIAATAHGLIEGYPDGTYKPKKKMTRGEFITILARQVEEELGEGFEIKDESSLIKVYKDKTKIYYISGTEYYDSHWSLPYATLLARLNMTSLSEDERNLRLDAPITRAEVAQLVNFYLLRAPADVTSSTKSGFPDVNKKHDLFADIIEATRKAHSYSYAEDGHEIKE